MKTAGRHNMLSEPYLKLLAREYPNARAAASEIINLEAICTESMRLFSIN